jgi:AraC family L-rhamnose operon regulatory protein RhaS
MSKSLPIYDDHGRSYQADTCQALSRGAAAGELRFAALVHGHYPGRRLPRGALAGVKSVGYWDSDHDQQWGLDWHRNEGIELTFLERGRLGFAVDRDRYQLLPGNLTLTRPWQRHRVGDPHVGAGRLHWLILDVGVRRPDQPWRWPSWLVLARPDREELTHILRHNEHPVWPGTPELQRCFKNIAHAIEADIDGNNVSRLTVLLNELFLLTLEMLRHEEVALDESLSGTQRTVELFLTELQENREYQSCDWTVAEMADRCGLGATQFINHCKQITNLTPIRYLNQLRLQTAADILRKSPQRKVTQVAMDCGFSSAQYFATVFRRQFGCSPQTYRTR